MLVFDTLEYSEKMQAVGFTPEQAKMQAETLKEILDENIATKRDLKEIETALRRDIKEMELRLKHDLTLRLGGMLVVGIGVVAILVKLL